MFDENSPQYIALIKANTGFKTDNIAAAVVETLKWLDAGAPHQTRVLPGNEALVFDMASYMDQSDELKIDYNENLPDCGTVCCIAGAIALFDNEYDSRRSRVLHRVFDTETYPELDKLFLHTTIPFDDITAKGAAKTLRRYIETGVVCWNREEQI